MNFKEWLINERNNDTFEIRMKKITSFLLKLYYGIQFNEIAEVPRELFSNNKSGKLFNWIKKFDPNFKSADGLNIKAGTESSVLFLGNGIVIKFNDNPSEANIAFLIKGDPDFPVLDVGSFNDNNNLIYVIAMKELKMSFNEIKSDVEAAMDLVHYFQSNLKFLNNQNLKKVVFQFNEYDFFRWLSTKKPEKNSYQILVYCIQIIKLHNRLYDKTGYFVANDIHDGNFGLTDKNTLSTFDYGYSDLVDPKKSKNIKIDDV